MNDPTNNRIKCIACRFLWPGNRCINHRAAQLTTRELPAEFTRLAQRCNGYSPAAP